MKKNRLGRSSLVVSDICMGTMTFGNQADEKTSFDIMDMAFDAGIDFFDTAETYGDGDSELFMGTGLIGKRDQGKHQQQGQPGGSRYGFHRLPPGGPCGKALC